MMASQSNGCISGLRTWLAEGMRRLRRDEKGVAALEFAFIFPIMFMLLVGAIEFSQALTVARRVTQSASTTADLIARAPALGLTTAQVDAELGIVQELMQPYSVTPLTINIVSVTATGPAGGVATGYNVLWSRDNHAAEPYAAGSAYTAGIPTGLLTGGESAIVGEANYTYTPAVFSHFIQSSLNLSEKFYLKPRNAACVALISVSSTC